MNINFTPDSKKMSRGLSHFKPQEKTANAVQAEQRELLEDEVGRVIVADRDV